MDLGPAIRGRNGRTNRLSLGNNQQLEKPLRLLRDAGPAALGVAGRAARARETTADHRRRSDSLVRAHCRGPSRPQRRLIPRGRPGRHPDVAVQRPRSARHPGADCTALVDPHGGGGPRSPDSFLLRRRPVVARGQRGWPLRRAHRVVRVRDHQHDADSDLRDRSWRELLRLSHAGHARQGVCTAELRSWRRDPPDRRTGLSDPRRPNSCGVREHAGRMAPEWHTQAVTMGGRSADDDVGEPARHPSRDERRHPRLSLVRARPPEAHAIEQPVRRRRDRQTSLQRRRSAVEQRGQHLQPRDG